MQRAFVIRPFGTKKDTAGTGIDFEQIHTKLIGPALKKAGFEGGTTGEIVEAGNIHEDIFALIIEAELVICDITLHNANVFYELGIRHALRKKHSVVIKGTPATDNPPFDIVTDRYLQYELADPAAAVSALTETIRATLASNRPTDSPVFKMLSDLHEVDAAAIDTIPTDFGEDVTRARAAESAGWLRLLASEVEGLRFQRPALKLVGNALWQLKDYEGARRTWESVRIADPDDLAANLALPNIFERLYRKDEKPELLEQSNLAIARVLSSEKITAAQHAEANALKARNLKTLWRLDFQGGVDLGTRRRRAAGSRSLMETYEAYCNAYYGDLNHYWSELGALQQGTAALDLSSEDTWQDAFDNEDNAAACKSKLKRQVDALQSLVSVSIDAALSKLTSSDLDYVWAKISAADLMFLVEARPNRIVQAYRDAIPVNAHFAWDAAKGQLQLFAQLGIKSDLANEIIRTIDARMTRPMKAEESKLLHQVVFAGHRVDEAGRKKPRFPAEREHNACDLIRKKLTKARDTGVQIQVLASAAPGSDILCHEVCRELSIDSTICLPMPQDDFARLSFSDLDSWRSRFLALARSRKVVWLSDQPGVPRWLSRPNANAWERGNRWVLEMARASGADKITLIALWDGRSTGDAPGGTAHMIGLARDAGNIDIEVIDSSSLLT